MSKTEETEILFPRCQKRQLRMIDSQDVTFASRHKTYIKTDIRGRGRMRLTYQISRLIEKKFGKVSPVTALF